MLGRSDVHFFETKSDDDSNSNRATYKYNKDDVKKVVRFFF